MRVIGTAGHVDHGKSTLIAALTGVHPDRLKEEQEREMTIDLGFGWLTLPDGEEIGIVDVPGHRDFIDNMLAGIGGIDTALLVIAADEGVMPQTKEHLAILDLLQIPTGIIVLTKTDLISDTDWLDLVENDIRTFLKETVLQDAPFVRVSAKTGAGLPELLNTLGNVLKQKPARLDLGRPRLPIDRVFSMAGFGTVVTGTLTDGCLSAGDEVEILPSGLKGRIRGLQTHKKKEDIAYPGSRTAINISGLSVEQIQRGDVVTHPGQYQPSRRLDARLRLLPDISGPLRHASQVKVFLSTSEVMATVRLLGTEVLNPGQEGWIQLETRNLLVAVRGDHYILRRPSPSETLGGGMIVDHQPKVRYKRFDDVVLIKLASLAQGTPSDVLLQTSLALGAAPIKDIVTRSRLETIQSGEAMSKLLSNQQLILLEDGQSNPTSDLLVMAASQWNILRERVTQMVDYYHHRYPLRRGIPREELKSRLKVTPRVFNALTKRLIAGNSLVETGKTMARPGHEIGFDNEQEAKIKMLMQRFEQSPYAPPTIKECQVVVGEEVLNTLVDLGNLVAIPPDVIFRKQDYEDMVNRIRQHLQKQKQITVAETRDLFNTSRRYALALLEHLDAIGVTARNGDFRHLRD